MLLAYTGASVAGTFFVTAGMFGAVSLYGAVTKRDLSSWGSFLFMGLIGVVIASVVNIFLKSDALGWVMAMAGVVVFTGLAAYDTNKLRDGARASATRAGAQGRDHRRACPHLDFINLFLMLLRLPDAAGSRREDPRWRGLERRAPRPALTPRRCRP